MRTTRFACGGLFAAALAMFVAEETAEGRAISSGESVVTRSMPVSPAPTAAPESAASAVEPASPAAAPALPPEPPQEVDRRRTRRRRWRDVNRYPGPIPTPAEWEPPAGPVKIALQAGHWRAQEAPRELSGLRDNGTAWGGTAEWQANLAIARSAGGILEQMGYQVEILPAVVPPGYRAHLFIAIHADGSDNPSASGYRVAGPRRDATGRAEQVVDLLRESYGRETGLKRLPTVTRRMQNYYAFNFRRYEHALHPMTIAVIIETGFLTSAADRRVILQDPDRAARGIVEAVRAFPVTASPDAASPDAGSPDAESRPAPAGG